VTSGFAAEQDDDGRRAFRRMLIASGIGHGLLLLGLLVSTSGQRRLVLPDAISVDLVASAPAPRSAARPAPKAPAEPAPTPEPAPAPKPVPKQVVLPEKPRLSEPKPRARKEVVLEPKPREEKSLDDLMKELREKEGEPPPTPAPSAAEEPTPTASATQVGVPGRGAAVRVSPEQLAWMRKVKVHVMRAWVLPASFRLQELQTEVIVSLDALGGVRKTNIVHGSGNPWYDEGVVRSIEKASPLPTPPESGDYPFVFKSNESY